MEKNIESHEYNAVKLNKKWYLIDSTWGAGYIKDNNFVKKYCPFYFCTEPNFFINTHYPINDNWQLLERPISFKQFMSNLQLDSNFFEDGFFKVEPNKNLIKCSVGKNKLILYKNNQKEIKLSISIYKLKADSSLQTNCLQVNDKKYPLYLDDDRRINKSEDIFEYEYTLNEKGQYCFFLFGSCTDEFTGTYKNYFKFYIVCS